MSEVQPENIQTPKPQSPAPVSSPSFIDQIKMKIGDILSSWQVKVGLVVSVVLVVGLSWFYWQHFVATMGLKQWSSESGAEPISCMVRDTNDDQYVSCSAKIDAQIVPLECGASILNIGCRVNYGAAAPPSARRPKPAI